MKRSNHELDRYRIKRGPLGEPPITGQYTIPLARKYASVVATNGYHWDHVSVSFTRRTPTWAEMCMVKDMFWDPEETVIQYHPPADEHVNYHPFCLHLWSPHGVDLPRPPSILVGKNVQL